MAYKICIASMAPFVGGAEVAAERLAIGLRNDGHEVFVLLGQTGDALDRMTESKLRCIVTPMYFTDKWHAARYLLARRAIRRILKIERPDIVHSNDLPTHQIMSDAARMFGTPRICHHRFPFPGSGIDWFNKYGAERHLFVSRALMEEMCLESKQLNVSSRSVVYDGLQIPDLPTEEDRQRARQEFGLPSERVIVTIAGQVIERKGVADLIQSWSMLSPRLQSKAQLLVVGDDLAGHGKFRLEMEQLAHQLNVPAKFVGFRKDVPKWLVASNIAVVPSHVEPLGNAVSEAMSLALPVVACHVGGIPEMVIHEKTGLLLPPRSPAQLAAAISRLILSAETRSEFGCNGRKRCEQFFSLTAHTNAVLREYQQLFNVGPNDIAERPASFVRDGSA